MGDAVEEPLHRGPTLALRRRSNPRQPFLYGALKSRLYILASQASETMGELVDFGRCDVHSATPSGERKIIAFATGPAHFSVALRHRLRRLRRRPGREQRPERRDEGERLVDHHVMLGLGDFDIRGARRDETQKIGGVLGVEEL